MTKPLNNTLDYFRLIIRVLNKSEKLLLLYWFFAQIILVTLDFGALVLAGLTASAFIPIIQSHPEEIPQVIVSLQSQFASSISVYEFLFCLAGISGLILLSRSLVSAVMEKYFYLRLSAITFRLAKMILTTHYKTPIEKRVQKSEIDLMHAVHTSLNSLTIYVLGNFVLVAAEILNSFILLGAIFIWKPLVTGVLICFIALSILISFKFHIQKSQILLRNFSELNSECMEEYFNLNRISSDLRLRGQFENYLSVYLQKRIKLSKAIAIRQVQFGFPRLILETSIILGGLFTGALIWYTLNIAQGLVVLSSLMLVGIRLQPAILKIQNAIQIMLQHKESSSAAQEVLLFYSMLTPQGENTEYSDFSLKIGKLEVQNLGYKFSDGEVLFNQVDIHFPETGIFLVKGKNGIGKTTIFEIMAGLRDPFEGSIEYKGVNLLEIPQEARGKLLCYLPQKPHFYTQTISDSLMLGETPPTLYSQKFKECLRILKVLQFDLVKHDLFTKLDLAEYLSEGEKAKLGLVRTLIRQPQILLLDEPTAALDPNSRIAVRDFLALESKRRLILIISHDELFDEIALGAWEI